VRDRTQVLLDGARQDGHYYVFEAGDLGEVGAWRRDESTWIELLAWSRSSAVRTGFATNQLTLRATGDRFRFEVNDIVVADVTDGVLEDGGVGLFVGGDGNDVEADRVVVRAAE
jgi:hypothetical protein